MRGDKCIAVVHPDMQHSLKLTKAVKDAGYEVKYFTTFYDKPGSLSHFLKRFLGSKYSEKVGYHYNEDVNDDSVIVYAEFICYILFVLRKYNKKGNLVLGVEKLRNRIFDKKVSKYIKKHSVAGIVTYDIVSGRLLEKLGCYPVKKIVDMSAAYLPYMSRVFSEEIRRYPDSSSELSTYLSSRRYNYHAGNALKELKYADFFIAASEFTKRSLVMNGVADNYVFICRYGIDSALFNNTGCERYPVNGKNLKCLFVGNVSVKKGFRYLIKALEIAGDNITVNVAGKNILLDNLGEVDNVTFLGHITRSELIEKYRESDVIIFPSLADGFGFSVLEAMACGVVPICSKNTGASDLIIHGENGFIIDVADYKMIACILNDIKSNKYNLSSMASKAMHTAKNITWDNYENDVKFAMKKIMEDIIV